MSFDIILPFLRPIAGYIEDRTSTDHGQSGRRVVDDGM
jgi:hypothetical protein